jgi:hypothetical protein
VAYPKWRLARLPKCAIRKEAFYDVTLTVYNGFGSSSLTLTAAIAVPDPLVAALGTSPSTDGFDGTASVVSVVGGSPPYAYLWDDPLGQSTKTANGLSPGWYRVLVSDSRGCERLDSVLVGGLVSGLDPASMQVCWVAHSPQPLRPKHYPGARKQRGTGPGKCANAQGQRMEEGLWTQAKNGNLLRLGASWPSGVYAFRAVARSGKTLSLLLVKE